MGKTATNLIIVLGLISFAFGGFYLYTQRTAVDVSFVQSPENIEAMLRDAQDFIEYSATLDKVHLKMDFFEDERLLSYQSFSTPIQDRPIGRPDPFAETTVVNPAAIDF